MKKTVVFFVILFLAFCQIAKSQNVEMSTSTLGITYYQPLPSYATPTIENMLGMEDVKIEVEPVIEVATSTPKGIALDDVRIDISISEQRLRVVENYRIRYEFLVSTGNPANKGSIETPRGVYIIKNYSPLARKKTVGKNGKAHYGVALVNWMAVARDGGVGIHALDPKEMGNYESLLGKKASHGCIRVSRKDSKIVSDWVRAFKKANGVYPQVYIY